MMSQEQKINNLLERGVEKIYPSKEALEKELLSGKRLKLYCGYDPSGPTLHFGHIISLRKLREFQDLGHEVIMLIGDFTGMIGDPTGKGTARKKLTRKEVLENTKNYKRQASKFLNFTGKNPAKIIFNSKWLDKLTFLDLIEIGAQFTVQQMIIRDMFQERLKEEKPIYLHEFFYPLAQAYDSVVLDVDLEVGGNDQTFNMLCGRDLQKAINGKEKFVLAIKLLTDPQGKKMGKSEGNMVALCDPGQDIYGKIMSWPDPLIFSAMELLTDVPLEEMREMEKKISLNTLNPKEAKTRLAREVVKSYYGEEEADKCAKEFDRVFSGKETPSEVKVVSFSNDEMEAIDLVARTGEVSRSEARRLIEQGAVEINNIRVDLKEKIKIQDKAIIQIGKRKFIRINHSSK